MRKIFLTSGLVLCMACPAFADLTAPTTTYPNGTVEGSNPVATPYCTEPTLEGYSGTSTFTAKWTPNTYTITYNKGTLSCNQEVSGNSPTSQTFTYDVATNLTSNGYSATGYTFGGWNSSTDLTAPNGTTGGSLTATNGVFSYTDGQSVLYKYVGNDAELTAVWNPVVSGDITLNASKYNAAGTTVEHSVTNLYPIRSVYGNRMIEGLCTGFLDGNGYEIPGGCEIDDDTVTSITPPTLTGYDFEGFYTAVNGSGTKVINANGTFIDCVSTRQISTAGATGEWYANWTPHVSGQITLDSTIYTNNDHTTVKYNTTTGGVTAATPTPLYSAYEVGLYETSAAAQAGAANNKVTTITRPSRAGYSFAGFYTSDNTKVIENNGTVLAAALTAVPNSSDTAIWYAHWNPITYKIDYTCGKVPSGASTGVPGSDIGGTSPGTSVPVTYDETFTFATGAPNCNCLDGYHFAGWHCSVDIYSNSLQAIDYMGTQDANDPNVYTVTRTGTVQLADYDNSNGHIMCDAIWQPNTIGTVWQGNGGTVTGGGESCTYDGGITLPSAVTRTGYTFGGWTVTTDTPGSCNSGNGGGTGGGSVYPGTQQ